MHTPLAHLFLSRCLPPAARCSDDELRPLAVGIFPRGALVNHACQPNTVHSFAGDRMLFRWRGWGTLKSQVKVRVQRWPGTCAQTIGQPSQGAAALQMRCGACHACLCSSSPASTHCTSCHRILILRRAVRAIQPGEEVTTSYTELAATRWERRRELLRHHQFDIDAAAVDEAASTAAAGTAAGAGSKAPETANGTTAAASSGGTTAGGPSAAALLFHPNQPPTVVLQMAGGSAELRLYSCQLPPWPHDKRDAALTAVVTAAPGGTANCSGSGSGSSSDIAAWGGMWGSLGLADEPSLTATPASASFDVAADLAGDEEPAAPGQQSSSAAGPSSASSVGQPAAAAAVHSWSAAGGLQHDGDLLAVQQLAAAYLEALQLQQSLDAMLAEGQAAAAVQRLQQSLAALAGQLGSRSSSSGAATSRLALGPRHVLRMRLLADLHRAAVAAEQWEAALAAAYELLPLYRQAYPAVRAEAGAYRGWTAFTEHSEVCIFLLLLLLHCFHESQRGELTALLSLCSVLMHSGVAAAGPAVGCGRKAGARAGAAGARDARSRAGAAHSDHHARRQRAGSGCHAPSAAGGAARIGHARRRQRWRLAACAGWWGRIGF